MDEPNKKEELLEGADEAKKLVEMEAKAAEYLAGWQRAKADFINYKKDEIGRFEELAKYSSLDIIREFINVLDSFDLCLTVLEKNGPVEKGVYMIRTQIEDILKKRGVEKINIEAGSDFDPSVSEAIAAVESEDPEGRVLEEIEAGYKLYEKIIRPARVKISKGKKQ